MRVQVLYFEGCPNFEPTLELVRKIAAALGLRAEVEPVEVSTALETKRLRFLGSPSVRVGGTDIDPAAVECTDYALGCRMYGSCGVPPRAMVEAALRAAASHRGGDAS